MFTILKVLSIYHVAKKISHGVKSWNEPKVINFDEFMLVRKMIKPLAK